MRYGRKAGRQLGRPTRWAVPAGAVLAVGAVVAGTAVAAGAQTAPSLPARTAAELLADAQHAAGPGPMTATVAETASLGLPALPGSSDSLSALSLLSGSHTFNIWYADPAHVRIAEPVQLGETDLRHDGRQVWLWSSKTQTATHIVLPSRPADQHPAGQHPAGQHPGNMHRVDLGQGAAGAPPTPQQVARQILAAVGPTTNVSVQRNVMVAGQPAYQLAIAPKDGRSLIGQVRIAIDANRYLPLRVQVFARGATTPAFQIGFTALSFGRPASSNFTFTPPPGAKVKTIKVPATFGKSMIGVGWRVGKIRPASGRSRAAASQLTRPLPRGSLYSVSDGGWPATRAAAGDGHLPGSPFGRSTVMGKGWLAVLVLPQSSPGTTKITAVHGSATTAVVTVSPSTGMPSGAGPGSAGLGFAGPGSGAAGIFRELLRAATPVHGTWGSGHLLRTSLVSVLITSKGTILVGAVAPSVLYSDAATIK